jgi:hypothetical protein
MQWCCRDQIRLQTAIYGLVVGATQVIGIIVLESKIMHPPMTADRQTKRKIF